MLEYRDVHDILQKLDDDLIDEAIYAKRAYSQTRRWATVAAAVLLCIFLSVGVVAAISPSFREWLTEQFQSGIVPEITEVDWSDEYRVENGFVIQAEIPDGRVYRIKNKKMVLCDVKKMEGSIIHNGEKYDYSLKYAKEGKEVYGWDFCGAVTSLDSYDENTGILELETDNVWNCYFIDYLSGNLTPVVDEKVYQNLWGKHYFWKSEDEIDWNWDGDEKAIEGYVKLAENIHVSPKGTYLLYRSNRDCLMTADGSYNIDTKGEWFVQNVKTREETKLIGASGYLHSDEIGFLDDSHISISWFGNELESDVLRPAIYDCKTKTTKELGEMPGANYGCSQIYEIASDDGDYEFLDLYLDETYVIPRTQGAQMSYSYVSRNLICVVEDTNAWKAYLVNERTALDFDKASFSDLEEIIHMYDLGNNQYLIEGISEENYVGYLLQFPELMKEENGSYKCQVTYPKCEKETQEILVTEEELENVLKIIENSESEVMSLENDNAKYGKNPKREVRLSFKGEDKKLTYILAVAEENILTYSIEKEIYDDKSITKKDYVIFSEELYHLVMEKTGGMKDEL